MELKYLQNIELTKIVQMAVERAVCAETKTRLLNEALLTDVDEVRFLLQQTDQLTAYLLKNGNPRISSCNGATAGVSRAEKGGTLSMAELLAIAGALRNFSNLSSWYTPDETAPAQAIDDLFFSITPQPSLEKDILDNILSETEMADNASNELYTLRRKIRQAESTIRDKLEAMLRSQNTAKFLQENIVSLRNGRYVVPVKAEHRGEVGGVIHDVSSSGNTLFVEPTAVVEANAKILQLRNQEQQEIERILQEYSLRVADYAPMFYAAYEAMLEIDKRLAKAELGLSMGGIKPTINTDMAFKLVKARHPLLDKSTAVPVDIELGYAYDTLIITGPNTGGKTVSLKTAGLLCAMAQLGYLIPAHDSSSVCVFEQILVDIGDEQSIEQSLSTFSGHMKNIAGIMQLAGPRALVLLDELGAGTDPAEGAALAVSIIESLRATGARIMATTHYAELKLFALDTAGVQNAGSEFDIESLRPTYKLIVGVPGRSNAFLIGEKLGLPQAIIENAKQQLSSEQRRFETVLAQLEDAKKELTRQENEILELQNAASIQLERAKAKREELIRQGEEELAAARRKAKDLSAEVENKAYELMDEMRRLEKDSRKAAAQKAQRAREIARKDAGALFAKGGADNTQSFNHTPLTQVRLGQEVYVPSMSKTATVTALPNKTGLVEIRMGSIKTKMALMNLAAPPAKTPPKKHTAGAGHRGGQRSFDRTPASEINLLGKTVDEALMEADQFLDNAVMSGLNTVYIIHGRGTGALRKAITQHLRGHKHVKSYRLGTYGEGEDGVTVAELK